MKNMYCASYLGEVKDFIEKLPHPDQAKIKSAIDFMECGDFESVYIKTLKTPIKELIVKKYRIIFFVHKSTIYFIGIFIKKTAKTPLNEIRKAENLYKAILENVK